MLEFSKRMSRRCWSHLTRTKAVSYLFGAGTGAGCLPLPCWLCTYQIFVSQRVPFPKPLSVTYVRGNLRAQLAWVGFCSCWILLRPQPFQSCRQRNFQFVVFASHSLRTTRMPFFYQETVSFNEWTYDLTLLKPEWANSLGNLREILGLILPRVALISSSCACYC